MKYAFLVGLFILSVRPIQAQFRYKAPIPPVKEKGYYRIAVKPAIVAKSQFGLNDLRIKSADGVLAPFFIEYPRTSTSSIRKFQPYKVLTASSLKSTSSWAIELNKYSKGRDLVIQLVNADIQKRMKIFGSNDLEKQWYVVKSLVEFNPYYLSGDSIKEITLSLPATAYRYLRVDVDDSLSGKINVLGFGSYTSKDTISQFPDIDIPAPSVQDSTSNQKSFITLTFEEDYQIDRIQFDLKSEFDFDREVTLEKEIIAKKGNWFQPIHYG